MRFNLLDRITQLEPGVRITAVKRLDADEEYLKDHFPHFPVMPGVLMLEALFQASMWLIRKSEAFASSVVLLKETRNLKYADFVQPGQTLVVTAEIAKQIDEHTTLLKVQGRVGESVAVNGRLVVERYRATERFPLKVGVEPYARHRMQEQFHKLYQPIPADEAD